MKKEIKIKLLAAAIEGRWRLVMACRRDGNRRIARGEALSSDSMLRLSRRIDRCSCALIRLQEKLDELSA